MVFIFSNLQDKITALKRRFIHESFILITYTFVAASAVENCLYFFTAVHFYIIGFAQIKLPAHCYLPLPKKIVRKV